MAASFEIGAQLAIIVNLAVEDHGYLTIFVESRLLAGEEIDDRQTAHAERDSIVQQITFRIRPAMDHAIAHRAQELFSAFTWRRARIEVGPTGYSTHKSVGSRQWAVGRETTR